MPVQLIVYGVVFLAIFLLFEGAYLAMFGKSVRSDSKYNRRLRMLKGGMTNKDTMEQLRKEMDIHHAALEIPVYSILAQQLRRAGMAIAPSRMIMIILGAFVISFVGFSIGTASTLTFKLLLSLVLSLGGTYFWVSSKANKRKAMMEEQLADSIELMVRSLRVGHPFSSAFRVAAEETPDPLGTEYGIAVDEIAYGRDIGESLNEMAERLEIPDMRFLAVAVAIQQQSGGNLADVLAGLAKVIRERFRLFRKIKAITAEAQWSGNFLSGFPVFALIGVNIIQPGYFDAVMEKSWFYYAAAVMGIFLVANLLVMRKIIKIKV